MANKAAKFLKKFLKSAYHLLVFILIASIIIFFGGFEIKADEPGLGAQAATLTGINPSSAYPGDTITLSGTGFGPVQDVGFVEFFDGSAQGIKVYTVTAWNDTSIECAIPQTALSGPVTVTNTSGKSNPLELIILSSGSLPADTTPGTGDTTAPDTGETTPESTTDTTGVGTGVTSETSADSTLTDAQKQLISQDLTNPDGNFGELDMVEQSSGFNSKKLIIKYKPDSKALKKLKEKKNTLKNKDKTLADKDIVVIEVADIVDMASVKEQLQKRSDIESVEADYEVKALFVPNDTYYDTDQYNMRLIDAERAWDISSGGSSSVTVAVIDTGVAYENYGSFIKAADLTAGTFVAGYNFISDNTHPNDDNGHGTHVTGTIAQTTNNALGCAGLAFNVKIMPLKILDSAGNGSGSDLIAAIYWAINNGAKVINVSLGGSVYNSLEQQAVQAAKNSNVMVICATGNNNGAVLYPAAYPESIAVGSVGTAKARSSFSNYGPQIDVVAPGERIYQETIIGSGNYNTAFYYYNGTSMATPHVAALAALILSVNPSLTYDQVENNIKNNCEDLGTAGFDNYYGYGLIDAYESLLDLTDHVPVASNAAIAPLLPTRYENLILSYDYSDSAGHTENGTQIRWYKNSTIQTAYNDLKTVPYAALQAGDQWYCTVTPSDGVLYGTAVKSNNTVTVYTGPKTLWYLPEGYTGAGFETFILMMNPSASTSNVKVSFLKSDGSVVEQSVTILPNSRSTVAVNTVTGMADSAFGTKVEVLSGPGIIVERAMYYSAEAHCTMAFSGQ
jgi:serine protease